MARLAILMGSPRPDGNTARLVQAFVRGLDPAHRVELISPAALNIHPCRGCNACFHHPENACVWQDDMVDCYARLAEAEVLVIATPLYFYSVSAQLKLLLDRLHNPIRRHFRVRRLVLLAVAGNPEEEVFEPLLAMYHRTRRYFGLEDAGVLCVPGVRGRHDLEHHPALLRAEALGRAIR